jgi:hypothetical protein
MIRRLMALLVVSALVQSATMAEDKPKELEGPVATELKKAKVKYESAIEKAGEKLLAALAEQLKQVEGKTELKAEQQIKLLEQLRTDRKAFEADSTNLPKSPGLKRAGNEYQTASTTARKTCEAAYDKAADAYRNKKEFEAAKVVLDEKKLFVLPVGARVFVGTYRWSNGLTVTIAADRTAQASGGDTATWAVNDKQECVLNWKSGYKNTLKTDGRSTDATVDGVRITKSK